MQHEPRRLTDRLPGWARPPTLSLHFTEYYAAADYSTILLSLFTILPQLSFVANSLASVVEKQSLDYLFVFVTFSPERERERRGLPLMMSTKFSDLLTPSSPCLHSELIHTIKFMRPPLLHPLFHDTPSPSNVDIISGVP